MDFLLDEYDLQVDNGDIKLGNTEQQNIELILLADKGQFRQHPLLGYGVWKLVNGESDTRIIENEIKQALAFDNLRTDRVKIDGNLNITVDATRLK